MPAILVVRIEGWATVEVVEGEVELSTRTEEPATMKEAGILVSEIRIQMEARAARIKNVGMRHA